MPASKVYFSDMRTDPNSPNLTGKLHRLMKAAGFESIAFDGKFTAVKVNVGEPGNLAYLRPNWAREVCDYVKSLGGLPFITDCNTLYVGGRRNGLEHLDSAYANGWNPFQTGVHTVIADGLKGNDEAWIPVEGGEYVKEAKIGRAIADADIVISLNHFKGHELTGFGGAIKNLGMGSGSRAGKMEMHSAGRAFVRTEDCIGCGMCVKNCAQGAPHIENGKCSIDPDKCVGCGRCLGVCPKKAIEAPFDQANDILNRKMAEYAKAVCQGKQCFHISLVIDVSPYCDCHPENDAPIVPNVGMFASFDPVALDRACADAVNAQTPLENTLLSESARCHHDHFTDVFPTTDWRSCLTHAEKIGLGAEEYELIKIG